MLCTAGHTELMPRSKQVRTRAVNMVKHDVQLWKGTSSLQVLQQRLSV